MTCLLSSKMYKHSFVLFFSSSHTFTVSSPNVVRYQRMERRLPTRLQKVTSRTTCSGLPSKPQDILTISAPARLENHARRRASSCQPCLLQGRDKSDLTREACVSSLKSQSTHPHGRPQLSSVSYRNSFGKEFMSLLRLQKPYSRLQCLCAASGTREKQLCWMLWLKQFALLQTSPLEHQMAVLTSSQVTTGLQKH